MLTEDCKVRFMYAKLSEVRQGTNNERPINLRVGVMSAFGVGGEGALGVGVRGGRARRAWAAFGVGGVYGGGVVGHTADEVPVQAKKQAARSLNERWSRKRKNERAMQRCSRRIRKQQAGRQERGLRSERSTTQPWELHCCTDGDLR